MENKLKKSPCLRVSVFLRLLGAPLRGSRSLGFLDFVSLSGSNLSASLRLCVKSNFKVESRLFFYCGFAATT